MPSMDEHRVCARNDKKLEKVFNQVTQTSKKYQSCLDERIKQNKSLPKTVSLPTAD